MEFIRTILKPHLTEKTYSQMQREKNKILAFVVDKKATKNDIKIMFMTIYNTTPVRVNTSIKKSVRVRKGTAKPGYSKTTKIAYITVPDDMKIVSDNPPNAETNDTVNVVDKESK